MTRFFNKILPVVFPVFFAASSLIAQQQNVIITVASDTVNMGDTVCLPITVQNFVQIVGAQLVVNWDNSALEFIRIEETGISAEPMTMFGYNFNNNRVLWSWEDVDPSYEGTTVPDGSTFFTACFRPLKAGVKTTVITNATGLPQSSPGAIENNQGLNLYGPNSSVAGMVCINELSSTTGSPELSAVSISPNPFNRRLQILNAGEGLFQLVDITGKTVFSLQNPVPGQSIQLPELLPGVYVGQWMGKDGSVLTWKMVRSWE